MLPCVKHFVTFKRCFLNKDYSYKYICNIHSIPLVINAEICTILSAQCSELASLTTYFCGGVLWDHRVSGEFWMEDAAVCVSVHGQIIQ